MLIPEFPTSWNISKSMQSFTTQTRHPYTVLKSLHTTLTKSPYMALQQTNPKSKSANQRAWGQEHMGQIGRAYGRVLTLCPLIVSLIKIMQEHPNWNQTFSWTSSFSSAMWWVCSCLYSQYGLWRQQKLRCYVHIPSWRKVSLSVLELSFDLCHLHIHLNDAELWGLPIFSWDLAYKLMVGWWYGLGMNAQPSSL